MTVGGGPRERLRILHLILMLGETNGQYNEHCLPMVGSRDITICTYFKPGLTPPPEIALFGGDGTLRGFFRALREALDAKEYDVVHAHAPESGALLVFALLLWRRFRRSRSSLVYTVQDSFHDYRLRNQALMTITLTAFERVVFCSRAAYDSLPRLWKWLVRSRWRVVQNGADIDRIDRAVEARRPTRNDGRFTVVSVGRLENVKDPMTLLEAFAEGAGGEARLTVIGAGRLETAVVAKAAGLGLDGRVLFTGLIPRDEVFVRCAEAEVLVSTSRGEGLPVAVIEAMAARCPAILSDIPPHRELADGADFIRLVRPGDVGGFAREIERFRAMPAPDRREIGHRSRQHVVERFSLPIMHAATESVYRGLPHVAGARSRVS